MSRRRVPCAEINSAGYTNNVYTMAYLSDVLSMRTDRCRLQRPLTSVSRSAVRARGWRWCLVQSFGGAECVVASLRLLGIEAFLKCRAYCSGTENVVQPWSGTLTSGWGVANIRGKFVVRLARAP